MFDSHIHTTFSTDSNMHIKHVLDKINNLNIGAVITEHMDIDFPKQGLFTFDVPKYFDEYRGHRSDKLLLGVEMGMMQENLDKNAEVCRNNEFDYVIGSIHCMNQKDLYARETYKDASKKETYEEYLGCMNECVKSHSYFDALGHIDYICRYSGFEDAEIYAKEHAVLLDEVLRNLALRGKAIEINTRRFKDNKAVHNLINIYKRFKELGGTMAVLGSDSHIPDSIGFGFKEGIEVAEKSGLKLIYFKNRKPEYNKF